MSTNIIEQLDAAAAPLLAARAEIERLHAEAIALRADADALQTALVQEGHRIGDIEQERAAAWQDAADAREQLAHAEQNLADLVAGSSTDAPALPRPPKLWGTAATIDRVPAIYTEAAMRGAINHAYAQGRSRGVRETRQKHGIPQPEFGPSREQWDREAESMRRRRGG